MGKSKQKQRVKLIINGSGLNNHILHDYAELDLKEYFQQFYRTLDQNKPCIQAKKAVDTKPREKSNMPAKGTVTVTSEDFEKLMQLTEIARKKGLGFTFSIANSTHDWAQPAASAVASGFLSRKTENEVRFAHLHVYARVAGDKLGRVCLAMRRHGSVVSVGLAFASNREQYVRSVGREIAQGRLDRTASKDYVFSFNVNDYDSTWTITEMAKDELEIRLTSGEVDAPHWATRQMVRILFPSEI